MNGGRSILVALVAAALAWAYVATHRPGPSSGAPDAQVSVWSVPPASISHVVYHDGERSLSLTPDWAAGKDQPYIWVDAPTPSAEAASQAAPPNHPRPEQLEGFKGNALAETTLKLLGNLRGKRALGRADKLDLAAYDLADSRRYVELMFADGRAPWRLDFGRATPGNVLRYVRARTNDTVYLVRDNLPSSLSGNARRLFDNQVFPFNPSTSSRIEIDFAGRTRTFFQVTGPDRRQKFWASQPNAEAGDSQLSEIVMRLERMQVEGYAPREQELHAAANLEVRLLKEGAGTSEGAWLKLFSGDDAAELAVSSHTRSPVRVNRQLVSDLIGSVRKLPASD